MSDTDQLAAGGDVEISELKLYNYNGIEADIRLMFSEIEIYEDIYSGSLSGSITLIDTRDLIKVFPIIGEEVLKLVYKTPGFPDSATVSQTFMIYKLTNIIVPMPHKQVYTLHFTTPETMTDLNKRISKAFTGTPDKLIERILGSDGLSTKKKYTLDQSSNNIKFVSPFWTPFKCINYLTSRAQSTDTFKSSHYLFFETNKQYRFRSVNEMFGAGEPLISYKYNNDPGRDGDKKTSQRDVDAEMMKIQSLTIDEKFDTLNRLNSGTYSHWVWDHNLLLKTISPRFYNYRNDFSKTNHLSPAPICSNKFGYSKNTLLSTVTTYPQSHNGISEDNYGKILTNKIPLMEQLNMMKMDIVVNGRSDLEVGFLVDIKIGGMEVLGPEDKHKTIDNNYNGRYLVTSILHRLTPRKHQMVIQVIKESVKELYK